MHPSESCLSLSFADDENALSFPSQPRLRRQDRSMYALRHMSNNNARDSRLSLRSFSGTLPSPNSSDCGSPKAPLSQPKSMMRSTGLPTPPPTDSEKEDETPSQSSQSTGSDGYPFPLQPVSLSPARANNLPSTPNRRCVSVRTRKARASPFPDRFISHRSTPTSPQSPAEIYRVSKDPQQLSPEEKLLRHRSATPDPFGPLKVSRIRADRLTGSKMRGTHGARRMYSRTIGFTTVSGVTMDAARLQNRQLSAGNVWHISSSAQASDLAPIRGVSNGRGGFLCSGSNAPMYESQFLDDLSTDRDVAQMEQRLATALEIDGTSRVLENSKPHDDSRSVSTGSIGIKRKRLYLGQQTTWKDGAWVKEGSPIVLDAPGLRDDYYCTVLACDHTSRTIAVGLANKVYLWSEESGVRYPPLDERGHHSTYVTSLSFSSAEGGNSILAVGRNTGQISLWSLLDGENVRFTSQQPTAIACVSFKPVTTRAVSVKFGSTVPVEELLVGDEAGHVYYYSIEWMSQQQVDIHGWNGHMKLLAKIEVHNQQICGLAWSSNGDFFATGANDNICNLFETKQIFRDPSKPDALERNKTVLRRPLQNIWDGLPFSSPLTRNNATYTDLSQHPFPSNSTSYPQPSPPNIDHPFPHLPTFLRQSTTIIPGRDGSLLITPGAEKHAWTHSAAVKAIAFCPWQSGLIVTGGGSNDRAIHFYHIHSGACLATINVHAQVTSLIWSTTRREVAATFGYPQPEHGVRIAVFTWPECRQVAAVPWGGDVRALSAVGYPGSSFSKRGSRAAGGGGRNGADGAWERGVGGDGGWYGRTREEGCIVVAGSDECVRFHEIWAGSARGTVVGRGFLGGSNILEGLEGLDSVGMEVIR